MKLRGASTPALRSFLSAAAALAVVVLLTASTNAQVVIELRSTARVAHDERLTLAHIAELTGPDAARWATVEIDAHEPGSASGRAGKTSWVRIGVDRVREAVAEQPDVHWGRILIRGSTCDVARLSPTDHPPDPAPATPDPAAPVTQARHGPTLRMYALERLATLTGAAPADLRVEFAEQDDDLLSTPTAGRVVQMHPVGKSERAAMSVRVYEGDRIVRDGTFRCRVSVRREALVVAVPIGRGELVNLDNTSVEPRWMGPFDPVADPARSIGLSARARLRPGQVVTPGDVEPAIAARKGDLVNVDCVAGSIVLRRTMRAVETVRDGEVVTLQSLAGKSTARARMNGPGRAVMLADTPADRAAPSPDIRVITPSVAAIAEHSPVSPPTDRAELAPDPDPARFADLESTITTDKNTSARVGGVMVERRPGVSPGRRSARYAELANRPVEQASRGK